MLTRRRSWAAASSRALSAAALLSTLSPTALASALALTCANNNSVLFEAGSQIPEGTLQAIFV